MIGTLDPKMMEAVLEILPVEFSIVDADDNVLAWNRHRSRIFKRPEAVVGRNVRACHPQKSLDKVELILGEMKAGTRERARFWIDLELEGKQAPQKILIEYYALRDNAGAYLGCLEVSQNITEIRNLTGQKRLLD